ncbi:MAG TPA: DUF6282 family protein [Terriglobales bacterium]|jgi:hypothetical protein|nr:DUF6282 family protein [Terriglobales bacterium]
MANLNRVWLRGLFITLLLAGLGIVTLGTAQKAPAGQAGAVGVEQYPPVIPTRGPVDLGLTDPALIGAIDVHEHLDPDAPGSSGQVRAIDAYDQAVLAQARGMRGFVYKTHLDPDSAGVAYLVRKHVTPGLQVFGRMALNFAEGGINVAAVHHFSQIKGGWGRIVEMPTLDSFRSTRDETPQRIADARPWMLFMPPGAPNYVPTIKNGELLPEVKYLIKTMARIRTVDSNGRLVLATGHATPEEHLLLAKEGRAQGLQVLITHGRGLPLPNLLEMSKLGAFIEFTGFDLARKDAIEQLRDAAVKIRAIGAENIVIGSDCGQTVNPLPTDCLVMIAQGLRAQGITERQINTMFKDSPARMLGLPPLEPRMEPRKARAQ